jgi:hypothetical protein
LSKIHLMHIVDSSTYYVGESVLGESFTRVTH